MKLEQLASLLKKDAAELANTLSLQITDEVPEGVISKEFESSLKLARIEGISEGKRQGEGKAKKEALLHVESVLKNKFEVDGSTFDEIVENLTGKVGKVEYLKDDTVIKQRDAWKLKHDELQKLYETKIKEFEMIETKSKVKSKLDPYLEKFEFMTDRVKQEAVNSFIHGNKFVIENEDIFLEAEGKLFNNFEQVAEKHLQEWGKPKGSSTKIPIPSGTGATNYGSTEAELFKALRNAKTPEEAAAIQKELEKL